MKILHTSDWHIGRALHGRKRYVEFESFFDWLAHLLDDEGIDVLLVAGDVFDNTAPSNRAQELYYRFLCRAAASPARHVVVTAGNHDSPSFLEAPRELLKFLNIHVVGGAAPDPADEVLLLADSRGDPRLIVCAVPYLRDRDIRTAEAGESVAEKERKIVAGIRAHYHGVHETAMGLCATLKTPVPIVAMGHLFAAGGLTMDGDGVRELYIGTLLQVGTDVFPPWIDYLALGHLHIPQPVGGSPFIRYSGSPLPLGFGQRGSGKSVVIVEISGDRKTVRTVAVPRFQELVTLKGDWSCLSREIERLKSGGSDAWLEIVYEGEDIAGDLQARLKESVEGSGLEILRVKNTRVLERVLDGMDARETLDDLGVTEVFQRCLDAHGVPGEARAALRAAYDEILVSLSEEDPERAKESGP